MVTVMELPKEPMQVQALLRCWYFSVQSIADVNATKRQIFIIALTSIYLTRKPQL
jgi:hypothetical protein